jgi:hypothetical protein
MPRFKLEVGIPLGFGLGFLLLHKVSHNIPAAHQLKLGWPMEYVLKES